MKWSENIKRAAIESPLFHKYIEPVIVQQKIERWNVSGKPVPPPHGIKQRNLLSLAAIYRTSTLIETGTYYGDMIAAALGSFDKIYSIEVYQQLSERAARRFEAEPSVSIINGDSAQVLPEILTKIDGPILFWLDGHYSGPGTGRSNEDTPLLGEMEAIASHRKGHDDVILVDDMRLFGADPAYPQLDEFNKLWSERLNKRVRLTDDTICFLP